MKKAKFSVCSDTGLAHLSALVGTPSLTLYGPTDTRLIGTEGINQLHVVGTNNNINSISIEDVISNLPSI
jgi:heptosyltransferase-1